MRLTFEPGSALALNKSLPQGCRFCGVERAILAGSGDVWVCKECVKLLNVVFARKDDVGDLTYVDKS